MTETVSQHVIAGAVLSMPVRIRKAVQHAAMFSVDAEAAQRLIDYSGLRVCRHLPGRALVVLTMMDYIDGDLGRYHEYATNVMVDPPGVDRAPATGAPAGCGRPVPFVTTCPWIRRSPSRQAPPSGAIRR
jgi:hypothetical protein